MASAYRFVSRNAHSSGAGGVFVRHIGSCVCDLISRTNCLQVPSSILTFLSVNFSHWQFLGSYLLFRGSQNFDRTELFGAVTCMTGMVGCGTTTVTQQIVPTVQVFFVAGCRLRVSLKSYMSISVQVMCAKCARFDGTLAMVLQDL